MKFKLDKGLAIKIACIAVFMLIAPFAMEFIILAEMVGIEALILSFAYYYKSSLTLLVHNWRRLQQSIYDFFQYLSSLYMFQPKSCLVHGSASFVILFFSGSIILSFYLWVPVMIMSSHYIL